MPSDIPEFPADHILLSTSLKHPLAFREKVFLRGAGIDYQRFVLGARRERYPRRASMCIYVHMYASV